MPVRKAQAVWNGTLKAGSGKILTGSGGCEGPFSFSTRFEDAPGTNPEELLGAAHAGCFSMALSSNLEKAGFTAENIHTDALVHLGNVEGNPRITLIELVCTAKVPGINAGRFAEIAEATKTGCPVSAALAATPIELKARLAE